MTIIHPGAGGRRRLARRVAAIALGAGMLVGSAAMSGTAGADPVGTGGANTGRIPDNFTHTYCFSGAGWTDTWKSYVNTAMATLDSQTLYTDSRQAACTAQSDITFQLSSAFAARGDYRCTSLNGAGQCATATIRLNTNTAILQNSTHQRVKTACHEIGHSVGLTHGTTAFYDDCMLSGTAPAGIQYERYKAHHVTHANERVVRAA